MKLLVGLGNPGKRYEHTHHNVGFMVLDSLAKDLGITFKNNKVRKVIFAKTDTLELIKPQTFMNNSGLPLSAIAKKHNVALTDILIVLDDIDMELGKIRFRNSGSSGGHKGMQSIINHLGTDKIARIKIGIGRSKTFEPDVYVTSKFTDAELSKIKKTMPYITQLIREKFIEL